MSEQNLVVLGATGSIGLSTLDVVSRNKEQYRVFALVAGQNAEKMAELCLRHQPKYAVMSSEHAARQLSQRLRGTTTTEVLHGVEAMAEMARHVDVDIVMSAIVGAAGLLPTLAAVEAGKKVLLANKESLVMSGQLFMDKVKAHGATLLPIDSEHNAIYQCLPATIQTGQSSNLSHSGVSKILLTGSGGPFLQRSLATLASVTVEEAVAHPNWSMGRKISVDSATMMNKGLEFIEAKWLFNCSADDIEVVIHPQSMIHSMVQYRDGSVLAQMGQPDMRTPIAYGLAYPERIDAGVEPLDFSQIVDFTFTKPDFNRYPNLKLAIDACRSGQAATTTVNAANEIAVAAFLEGKIGFCDIYRVNALTLEQSELSVLESVESIMETDRTARHRAQQIIATLR
ncbi:MULTISPECIES: 1-deoxy-D-xylulose-5-phosphate reductoisomerase [Pseudoalteromonas]|uniref:1-deoxy-D-xylulose 5-phosphate reductoisomerase n=1 Tax=Pseudoalteromonas piscicida TaxID=43662 RepID=A0ABM6NE16_PSEO7|nr:MULTISPECIES: 1-deoxy-D-xylulose-5-phosphate reductoisomerase [Pseudoalteromonas]ATD06980.1 1-deoxy-D-xylulose-5-phosphate reductoisomerase [Pseudoalteromonas piscicida]MCO7197618.1 1-deoxy-D-xylulose-5-phosphate reductoisomerase [Pseudoalteromonas sp. OANN1]WPU33656.1 1-deoxy-D-xylulose-5-phosphate reductoisomerase [Pseudoalteromonas piscicida]